MKVDYDLYYKDSGSVNKGHYVESNESVSISLSHDYTTLTDTNLDSQQFQCLKSAFTNCFK